MRFKTDENIHPEIASALQGSGHDAVTVWDQGLRGQEDERIAEVCRREARGLMTLDLDFANIRTYPPEEYSGLIVFRLRSQSRAAVLDAVLRMMPILEQAPLVGHLWIVDECDVRIRGPQA